MDSSKATEFVFNRVQKIEPKLAYKIIQHLLSNENSEREMIRLAFGPDCLIDSLVNEAKSALLGFSSSPISPVSPSAQSSPDFPHELSPYPRVVPRPMSTPAALHVSSSPYWDSQIAPDQHLPTQQIDCIPSSYPNTVGEEYRLLHQFQLEENLDNGSALWGDFLTNNYYSQETSLGWEGIGVRTTRRSASFPESQVKACHYYYKGYCKHGTSCRYFHGQSVPDSFSKLYNNNQNDMASEDNTLSPGSLEKLELEIAELLKSQGGQGISIAMLPLLYYEKYRKHLQAEGYLTESQRHGKAGYSLTKLLARLKNSIRIIDRPHGQHSIMLVEDASRHMEYRSEMSDSGNAVTSSQQIYLTFPAESSFTEEDVSNYFNQFGTVHAVRIPPQQKRMFGFVTFVLPETAKMVLNKGNPHYICGARVLAKPYREKTRNFERKYNEKIEIPTYHPSQSMEVRNMFHSGPRALNDFVRRRLMDNQEKALAFQMRRLSGLHLAPRQLSQRLYFGYDMEEASLLEDPANFTYNGEILSPGYPGSQLDALNYNAVSEDKSRSTCNNCSHQESQVDLPESPFASPRIGSRISTLV